MCVCVCVCVCVCAGFVNPFSIAGVMVGHEWFLQNSGLCHLIGSICLVSCVCSLWSIAAISLNRYVLLCQQRYYSRIFSWRSSAFIAACLWLVALCLDLPNFLDWGDHTYDMKTMACSYDRTASYSYTVFFITLFVTIPLMVVLYCNINIYIFVLRSKIRVAAHKNGIASDIPTATDMESVTNQMDMQTTTPPRNHSPNGMIQVEHSSQAPLVHQEAGSEKFLKPVPMEELQVKVSKETYNKKVVGKQRRVPNKRDMRREVRLARTLFIVFMAFCTCWAPYALICLTDRYDTVSKVAYTLTILLAHSSSTLNSILYAATNKGFRDGYKVFLISCGFKCFS